MGCIQCKGTVIKKELLWRNFPSEYSKENASKVVKTMGYRGDIKHKISQDMQPETLLSDIIPKDVSSKKNRSFMSKYAKDSKIVKQLMTQEKTYIDPILLLETGNTLTIIDGFDRLIAAYILNSFAKCCIYEMEVYDNS